MSFSAFVRERQFLSNVSPATLEWYKHSFKWLRTESPSQDELKDAVLRMREKGLKATGCNLAIRAIRDNGTNCDRLNNLEGIVLVGRLGDGGHLSIRRFQ